MKGIKCRYSSKSDFVEVDPQGFQELCKDQARIEWVFNNLVSIDKFQNQYVIEFSNSAGEWQTICDPDFRVAIDDAISGDYQ